MPSQGRHQVSCRVDEADRPALAEMAAEGAKLPEVVRAVAAAWRSRDQRVDFLAAVRTAGQSVAPRLPLDQPVAQVAERRQEPTPRPSAVDEVRCAEVGLVVAAFCAREGLQFHDEAVQDLAQSVLSDAVLHGVLTRMLWRYGLWDRWRKASGAQGRKQALPDYDGRAGPPFCLRPDTKQARRRI